MSSSSNSACGIVEKLLNYLHPCSFFLDIAEDNLFPLITCLWKRIVWLQFSTVQQALWQT